MVLWIALMVGTVSAATRHTERRGTPAADAAIPT
jgi:hypothetical protein